MSYTLSSFFAGVGGIDLGFEQAGQMQVLYANEFDKYAVTTYNADFKIPADCRDIHEVLPEEVPDSDIIAGCFPCQAFSIAGKRQGFDDEKGRRTLFFELMRIIRVKHPRVVFLENVRNLVSHGNGEYVQGDSQGTGRCRVSCALPGSQCKGLWKHTTEP